MKIINETSSDMTLSHPSTLQTFAGGALMLVGAALFLASATGAPDALLVSVVAFACFGAGVVALFLNATETIDLNKAHGEIVAKRRGLGGAETHTYPLAAVRTIELKPPFSRPSLTHRSLMPFYEASILLADGTRLPIDYEYRFSGEAVEPTSIAGRVARFLGVPVEDRCILPPVTSAH